MMQTSAGLRSSIGKRKRHYKLMAGSMDGKAGRYISFVIGSP